MKLLDKEMERDLHAIREIRNVFAHARLSVNFDTPEITAHVRKIKIIERYTDPFFDALKLQFTEILKKLDIKNSRLRFLNSCVTYCYMLKHFPPDPEDYDEDDQ